MPKDLWQLFVLGLGLELVVQLSPTLHYHAHHSLWRWGSERNSGSKEGSKLSLIYVHIWQCLCLAVTQFVNFSCGNTCVQLIGSVEQEWLELRRKISSSSGKRLDVAQSWCCFPNTLLRRERKPWIRERMLRHVQGAGWMPALEKAEHPRSLRGGAVLLWQPDTEPWFSWQGFRLASLAMSFGLRQCPKGCRNHLQYSLKFASMFRNAQQLHHIKAF